MKIAIITMWYNERILGELFLRHYYKAVDAIHILLDQDTDDGTEKLFSPEYKTYWIYHKFTDGMNDLEKIAAYNEEKKAATAYDYVIGLDADEFIYQPEKLKGYLSIERPDVQRVAFHQMYQHRSERAINTARPVFEQRKHGDPDLSVFNGLYVKPCIVDPKINASWTVGCHGLIDPVFLQIDCRQGPAVLKGAHWAMADPDLAVKRRLAIKARQSQANLEKGFTVHNHHVTEEEIRKTCKAHENDPKLF